MRKSKKSDVTVSSKIILKTQNPLLSLKFSKSFACHSYAVCMSLVCTQISSVCHSHLLAFTCISSVWHSYVLACHLYINHMYSYVTRVSLICTLMSSVCHSYVIVCCPYVRRMYSYVILLSLVCGFTRNPSIITWSWLLVHGFIESIMLWIAFSEEGNWLYLIRITVYFKQLPITSFA